MAGDKNVQGYNRLLLDYNICFYYYGNCFAKAITVKRGLELLFLL